MPFYMKCQDKKRVKRQWEIFLKRQNDMKNTGETKSYLDGNRYNGILESLESTEHHW